MYICYEDIEDGISITRIYGDSPVVEVPETVDGKQVVALGAYAFSDKSEKINVKNAPEEELESGFVCEIAGEYITEIILPGTVKNIGEFCFYQCINLKKIHMGSDVQIGSDAFMNCKKLDEFHIRASVKEPTSLRYILAQRTQETDVYFSDAALHFPEYTEQYDLIGPAHIFELNIVGEGFRARKCFDGDFFLLDMYDDIFEKAMDVEDKKTLCKMAVRRLEVQTELKEEKKILYQRYLLDNLSEFLDECIAKKDISIIMEMGRQGLLDSERIGLVIRKMTQAGWVEGTRAIITGRSTGWQE